MNEIVIYTDGGCHGNPGPGGWGIVVIAGGIAGGRKDIDRGDISRKDAVNDAFDDKDGRDGCQDHE